MPRVKKIPKDVTPGKRGVGHAIKKVKNRPKKSSAAGSEKTAVKAKKKTTSDEEEDKRSVFEDPDSYLYFSIPNLEQPFKSRYRYLRYRYGTVPHRYGTGTVPYRYCSLLLKISFNCPVMVTTGTVSEPDSLWVGR